MGNSDRSHTIGHEGTELEPARVAPRRLRWLQRGLRAFVAVVALWLLTAYVILPTVLRHYDQNPRLEDAPKTTVTSLGIPGDPLNVGLIGSEDSVLQAMLGSGWTPADPVTIRSSLRIAWSVVRDQPYPDAPVSPLFVFGRKQDLAFQKAVGDSARRRHHVRFWKAADLGRQGIPLWIGAVTFDTSVGLSRNTAQITHHIDPDVDAERDALIGGLSDLGWLLEIYQVTGVGATLLGRNGGGDPYYTDGELSVGILTTDKPGAQHPLIRENPSAVKIKDQFWSVVKPLLHSVSGH